MKIDITILIILAIVMLIFVTIANLLFATINLDGFSASKMDGFSTSKMDGFSGSYIIDSVPIDRELKYKTSYYFEYDNREYYNRLKEIFQPVKRVSNWSTDITDTTPAINTSIIVDWIIKKIELSKKLALSKRSVDSPHKIIAKTFNLISVKTDGIQSLYDIEIELYREDAFEGKHVDFKTVFTDSPQYVQEIKIIGVVNADSVELKTYNTDPYLNYDVVGTIPNSTELDEVYSASTLFYQSDDQDTRKAPLTVST